MRLTHMSRSAVRRSSPVSDDRGVTLVELLVVLTILGIVGGIATLGVVSALQSARHTQERVEATQELEIGVQRIARDFRGAARNEGNAALIIIDPPPGLFDELGDDGELVDDPDPSDPETFGFAIRVTVPRSTNVVDGAGIPEVRFEDVEYFLDIPDGGAGQPARLIRQVDDTGEQTLVTLVDVDATQPIFRFVDGRGQRILDCVDDCKTVLPERTAQLEIVLTRNLRGRDTSSVSARTRVAIRNIRYEETS